MNLITVEVTRRYIGEEGHMKPEQTARVSPQRARQLIENRVARVLVGPSETKTATPAETASKKIIRRAEGWPVDPFGVVERAWQGHTVVCIAGGPSLDAAQCRHVERVRRSRNDVHAIGINNAYLLAPWAELLYFADGRWWEWHDQGVECKTLGLSAEEVRRRFHGFTGQKVTIWGNESHKILDEDVIRLRNVGDYHEGGVLCREQNGLATGRNSGFQAINLAVLTGATRILLLGYDMQAKAGRPHWFGDHPLPTSPRIIEGFRAGFERLARHMPSGVEIINCSAETALTCFPRAALESVLPDPAPALVPA